MSKVRTVFLFVTVLITGSVVMAIELLGARFLSVCYGGSIHVWAAMISVTLLSLAVGYFLGGVVTDRKPQFWLLYAIILASGVFACAAPFARFAVRTLYGSFSIQTGTLISSFTVFFIPLTLLGMCGPFVIRLLSVAVSGAGKTAGSVYAISTVGSVGGTLLTSLWLIPVFGTPLSFRVSGCALIALSGAGLLTQKSKLLVPAAALLVAAALIPTSVSRAGITMTAPDGTRMKFVHATESAYGRLTVIDKNGERLLLMNGILQTGTPIHKDELSKGVKLLYDNYFLELMPYCFEDPRGKRALLIGLAGGLLAEVLELHGVEVMAVEIDPEVVGIARKFFEYDGDVIIGDGRQAVEDTTEPFDICVIDAYSGDAFPFHMASIEMFKEVSRVLGDEGVLGINYIGEPDDEATMSLLKTVGAVFDHVEAFRTQDDFSVQAMAILASHRDLQLSAKRWLPDMDFFAGVDPISSALARHTMKSPRPTAMLLTDKHNPIDFYRAKSAKRWRNRTAEILGYEAILR
jgi:spermidine synthase